MHFFLQIMVRVKLHHRTLSHCFSVVSTDTAVGKTFIVIICVSKCYPTAVDWVHTCDRQIRRNQSFGIFGEHTSKRYAAIGTDDGHLWRNCAPTLIARDSIRPDVNIVAEMASIRLTDISSNLFQSAQLCTSDEQSGQHTVSPAHIAVTT